MGGHWQAAFAMSRCAAASCVVRVPFGSALVPRSRRCCSAPHARAAVVRRSSLGRSRRRGLARQIAVAAFASRPITMRRLCVCAHGRDRLVCARRAGRRLARRACARRRARCSRRARRASSSTARRASTRAGRAAWFALAARPRSKRAARCSRLGDGRRDGGLAGGDGGLADATAGVPVASAPVSAVSRHVADGDAARRRTMYEQVGPLLALAAVDDAPACRPCARALRSRDRARCSSASTTTRSTRPTTTRSRGSSTPRTTPTRAAATATTGWRSMNLAAAGAACCDAAAGASASASASSAPPPTRAPR